MNPLSVSNPGGSGLMGISTNLAKVRQRILRAAEAAGRDPKKIKLVAVSKFIPYELIQEAYRNGQYVFAESRVQEWADKAEVLPKDCEWHFIGRLQTNKVKYLDHRISLIHSLDRFSLLKTLEEYGERKNHVWSALVQVNIARDSAKAGFNKEEMEDFLSAIAECKHVKIHGLMTIGALDATPAETKGFFRELKELSSSLQKHSWPGVELKELSMGMSEDFELAIEEGATLVRVGRDIFGDR